MDKKTIAFFNEFGFPVACKIKEMEITEEPYAQYRDALKMTFKLKGKQKRTGLRIYGCKKIYLFDGWIDLDVDMFKNGSNKSFLCFSDEYVDAILKSTKQKPKIISTGLEFLNSSPLVLPGR